MKLVAALSLFLLASAKASNDRKESIRRRIQQALKANRKPVEKEAVHKKINTERRRMQMMPDGEKGAKWEAGSYTWGTYMFE